MKALLACAVAAMLLSGCIVYGGDGWHHPHYYHPVGVVVY